MTQFIEQVSLNDDISIAVRQLFVKVVDLGPLWPET